MGKLYGKYRGEVIDARDPKGRMRLLIKVPSLGDIEVGWAESCLPPEFFILPERGDFVWVDFEEGDIQKAVWTGMFSTTGYKDRIIRKGRGIN